MPRTMPRAAFLQSAGASGFLEYRSDVPGGALFWTRNDGTREKLDDPGRHGPATAGTYGVSDVVALEYKRQVVLRDMVNGTVDNVTVPTGQTYMQSYGRTVLTGQGTGDQRVGLHLLHDAHGTTVDVPVTGLPEGSVLPSYPDGSSDGFLLYVDLPGASTAAYAWVDLTDGETVMLPKGVANLNSIVTAQYVLTQRPGTVTLYAHGNWDAPAHTVAVPSDVRVVGAVGDALVVARHVPEYGEADSARAVWRLSAVPFDGSAERTLATRASEEVVSASDGGLVFAGGESATDYGIGKITADADGHPQVARIVELPPVPMAVAELTVANGRLVTLETGNGHTTFYGRDLSGISQVQYGARQQVAPMTRVHDNCTAECPPIKATGDGRIVYTGVASVGTAQSLYVMNDGPASAVTEYATGFSGIENVALRAASGRTAVVGFWNGINNYNFTDIDTGRVVRKLPQSPWALWGHTLWTPTGTTGVNAQDVRSGARIMSFPMTGCTGSAIVNAVSHWVNWSCTEWEKVTSAVYDTLTKKQIALPRTDGALRFGDGFVVNRDLAGGLTLYDFHSGTVVKRRLAEQSGTAWSVDPYTGYVAYSDAAQNVHVLNAGVPTSALSVPDSQVGTTVDTDSSPVDWRGKWWLSKPAASWKLVLKHKATGAVVRTLSGGAARSTISATWDGRSSSGALLANGAYTWTLTAGPADGTGAVLTNSGSVKLSGGAAVRRDFAGGDGFGDLLTQSSSGTLAFHQGGAGTFSGSLSGGGWATSVTAVPFGDLSGDRCNDVLVRLGNGSLRGYKPACGKALTPSTPYTALGTGFQQYNVLTYPGDISGDGRPDLIGRQSSTGDVYLYKATGTGTLASRVKIASRWTVFKKLVGVGDLNGDGFGDLLAQDTSNELWRFSGDGKGHFKPRVLLARNWGAAYNAVVGVGDITGDGKADLVVRDTAGVLYRYGGNGKGTFGGRVKIATGWKGYKAIL
ncbi:FG-GAP-like repeat-containing protein [Streptomyces sp. NPDC088733]|uniref:FG-GAP-like repeat-containing protein n=1 Tax=Streptomyces sp. NPDC088733 TaxID=3365880 RepID=UPI0037FAFEC2